MKSKVKTSGRQVVDDPEARVQEFIAKFDPDDQARIRAVRKALQRRFPTANELVYDNYNFFVIGYSPTERPSDSIVSLAAGASGIGLSFPYCGARLPDPHKLLLGSGTQNRFIRLESAKVLARPEVEALISAAVSLSKALPENGKGKVIIRSALTKHRPRRKSG
jgi:hypothetical protein